MTMPFSFISLGLLSFLSHLTILTAQLDFRQFIYFNCFHDEGNNYTDQSAYGFNLNTLLYNLTSDTNIDYGFYNMTQGEDPDRVSAIGLCRGDLKPDACRSCLHNATSLLLKECPNQKEATGYNDGCMLRYSDLSIFGLYQKPDYYFPYSNKDNATDANFNRTVNDLLQNLRRKAAAGDSRRKFAASPAEGWFQESVYGLVQCTPDLSEQSCDDCLQMAILELNKYCGNKVGARIVKLSCNVRYEKYRFYDEAVVSSLQAPPPSPTATINTTISPGIFSA